MPTGAWFQCRRGLPPWDLRLHPLEAAGTTAKFDLALTCTETAEGFAVVLEHATDLFDRATAERFLGRRLTAFRDMLQGCQEVRFVQPLGIHAGPRLEPGRRQFQAIHPGPPKARNDLLLPLQRQRLVAPAGLQPGEVEQQVEPVVGDRLRRLDVAGAGDVDETVERRREVPAHVVVAERQAVAEPFETGAVVRVPLFVNQDEIVKLSHAVSAGGYTLGGEQAVRTLAGTLGVVAMESRVRQHHVIRQREAGDDLLERREALLLRAELDLRSGQEVLRPPLGVIRSPPLLGLHRLLQGRHGAGPIILLDAIARRMGLL